MRFPVGLVFVVACGSDPIAAVSDATNDGRTGADAVVASDIEAAPVDAPEIEAKDVAGEAEARTDTAVGDVRDDVADAPRPSVPTVWDLDLITDESTIDCVFSNPSTVLKGLTPIDTWEVTYRSYEVIDGEVQPIAIRAFAARPSAVSATLPGIVVAHGLGGFAKLEHATGAAALTGAFALAFTGPGGGDAPNNTSEGLPSGHDDGYRMFDTIPDPRGSWFWGHAVAAMRGLTCLGAQPQTDASRLGMTGYSAGGVVTLIASAVDPRVKAGVALSASGAWDVAVQSDEAWQHSLLGAAGLDANSEQWLMLLDAIDSAGLLPGAPSSAVMMVNGTSDEFFPLTAHVATFDAIPTPRRTSLIGNFDHGCFALTGVESADTITARAELRANGAQRLWFGHHFGDPQYATLPETPTMVATAVGPATQVTAEVDAAMGAYPIESVKVWWSNDDAFLWGSVELQEQAPGLWAELALFPLATNTITFVDVVYSTGGLLPEKFSLSSRPEIPAGLVPHIRAMDTCL